ncbi:sodium:solute symporter [Streptomyces sp. NBC_00878]|uniref:sodium:solute symporter family protein n=1 Tax=Streptomyces sp. NBC_00878 TaxID=2975854 RepID=UPI002250EE83|nr:sodium:solute symporter family protein [Streptomyces sp. NBC_00878]MCX4904639.1 sodium:solute symporter family protein [Streptomyces sp. NBC_00878]
MTLLIAIVIVLGTTLGAIGFGRRSGTASAATVSNWAVGGRRFGVVLFWFMNAGEIYTTFAVLGISGYAWALGAPAYLAFTSVSLSYAIGYWLMPKIWRAGRKHGLITQADFFTARFDAPWLGAVTALVGIAALIVYVQIQLVSLSLIVRLTIGSAVSPDVAVVVGALLMLAFVFLAGLRSAAFSAGVKDVLMIVVMVLLTVTVAGKVGASSFLDIFHLAEQQHPGIGSFPGIDPESPTTTVWLMTSALNVALGNWVFPHLFQVSYSAASGSAIRRNAIWQPLYSLAYFFIILLGFAALVAGTKPEGGNLNAALLQFVSDEYPSWVIGLVAGTGFLLALAPGSVLLLTSGSLFARNVVGLARPDLSDRTTLWICRLSMTVFAAVAVWLTLGQSTSLVDILLYAYSAIGMLAPGVFFSFVWRRTSAAGVLLGIITGFVALLAPFAKDFWAEQLPTWEPGLIAMAINAAVLVLVSVLTPAPKAKATAVGLDLTAPTAAPAAEVVRPAH